MQIYIKVSVVCIIFFLFQEFTFFFFGFRISGLIPFLPFSAYDFNIDNIIEFQKVVNRSCSFFLEPSHFAQFLLPLLAICVFSQKMTNRKILLLLSFAVIVLLKSGNALIGLLGIAIIYLFKTMGEGTKGKIKGITIASFIFAGTIFYIKTSAGEELMNRSNEIENNVGTSSGFIRIFRGYYVFNSFDFREKLIGIDNDNTLLNKVHKSYVGDLKDFGNELYFNMIQNILLRTGLIGLFIFSLFIFSLWKIVDIRGRTILLIFLFLGLVAPIFFSPMFAMYIMLAYSFKKRGIYSVNDENFYSPTKNKNIFSYSQNKII